MKQEVFCPKCNGTDVAVSKKRRDQPKKTVSMVDLPQEGQKERNSKRAMFLPRLPDSYDCVAKCRNCKYTVKWVEHDDWDRLRPPYLSASA